MTLLFFLTAQQGQLKLVPFPLRRAFNCCVLNPIEAAEATYRKMQAVG